MKHFSHYKVILILILFLTSSCASYKQFEYLTREFEIPSKVFPAGYNTTWNAATKVMRKYNVGQPDIEKGIIKTVTWVDNTLELNFSDAFGSSETIKAARFKLIVNIIKGFRGNKEVTKVTIYKRQMIEKNYLQGWKVIPSDGILEETILYRIGRLIQIDQRLQKIDEQKAREQEKLF